MSENHKAEIRYESKGKTPAGDSFLTVKKARGYYEYSERGGMDSIAFILYDSVTNLYALIDESKPPMDERNGELTHMSTAFGGSMDMDKTPKEICQIEVLEETGYEVPMGNITFMGRTLVSSQMSQMCELFFVNVSDIKQTVVPECDNEFAGNSVIWMNSDDLLGNDDWKSIFILMKAIVKNLV